MEQERLYTLNEFIANLENLTSEPREKSMKNDERSLPAY